MAGRACPLAVLSAVLVSGVVLLLCLLSGMSAAAQTAGSAQPAARSAEASTPPVVNVEALPISLDRIGEQLEKTPVLDLSATRPTFRVQIFGTRPRWTTAIDWLGTADGRKPPAGPPWHTPFLDLVTPPAARAFGAFTGTDLLQVMATSLAQGVGAAAVIGKIKSTVKER